MARKTGLRAASTTRWAGKAVRSWLRSVTSARAGSAWRPDQEACAQPAQDSHRNSRTAIALAVRVAGEMEGTIPDLNETFVVKHTLGSVTALHCCAWRVNRQ